MENQNRNHDLILKLTCVISSLFKKWTIIVLCMLICGIGLDVYKTLTYVSQYSSTMTAILDSGENTYSSLQNTVAYIKTLDYIFNGQVIKNDLKEKLHVDDLDMTCTITSINNTNIVNIQVLAPTKRVSYLSLNEIVNWYKSHSKDYHFTYKIEIVEDARLNENPINTLNHMKNFLYGFIGSGIILCIILGLMNYFKDTIKTPKDIQYRIDCRLFAKIPKELKPRSKKFWKKKKQAILITSLKTSFHYKEAIKKLRSRFEQSAQKHQYRSLMITSSLENEGKSSIAANLALALAKNGKKVLIIDADIRKPSLHKIFELKTDRTINHYLEGQKKWESQVEYLKKYDLFVMCASQDLKNAEELTNSDAMRQLIQLASEEFEFVILDSSPSRYLNEPIILNEMVDASLLVVKQDEATTTMINETISRLVNAKNNLIGCIYNASILDFLKEQKVYGYRYGYNRYSRNERRS